MGLLDDAVVQLARFVRAAPGNLGDEHARWEIYLKAMNSRAARELLLRAIDAESDANLATSVVLRMIEELGEAERADWVNSLRGDKREYAHRRALELSTLERISSGKIDSVEVAQKIDGWTDWLQLRIADSATSAGILDIVGDVGRTRRIRNAAKGRRAKFRGP